MQCPPLKAAALALVICTAGCTAAEFNARVVNDSYSPPTVTPTLQLISAGYTGCMPKDNQITVVSGNPGYLSSDGTLWKAVCQGTTYLCSTVPSPGTSGGTMASYSCAPAKQ